MSYFNLKKDVLEAFDRAKLDLINFEFDNLNNIFKYMFPIFHFQIYDVDWGRTNNLLVIINKSQ